MKRAYVLAGSGALAVLGLGAIPILAQQNGSPEAGGPVLTFGIAATLSAVDNYNLSPDNEESSELFDTRLSLGYRNRRAIDSISLDLGGVLRAIEPPRGAKLFDDRTARLGYQRQGVNSALSFGADYSLSSVDARDPFDQRLVADDPLVEENPLDEADLRQDRGDQQQIGARVRFETGLGAPLGLVLTGRYRERTFTDTTDPQLFDTQQLTLSGTTRFTVSPITETRVVLNYEDYSAEDVPQTDRQTTSVNLGLTQALTQVDTLDVSVGLQQIETEETVNAPDGQRQSTTDNGVIGNIGLSRELTRGTIGTTFVVNQSENGQTTTWQVNRALPLPRGSLSFSIGATRNVANNLVPSGRIDFSHEMLRSTLTASLSQDVRTSDRSNELRTTRASLGYDYEINALSRIGVSADFAALDRSGGPQLNNTTRANLRASYSRSLTRDWALSTGYEYRFNDEDTVGQATSNRVFLTLRRSFAVRP